MNYFFISGTSRGIGNALAKELLKNLNNYVIGFSRTNTIKHERFEFIPIDLSIVHNAFNFKFINIIDADSIVLVNNSGTVGNINHIGNVDNQMMVDTFNINAVSPAILTNNFVKAYQDTLCKKLVINISSGAAKYAIELWSSYCAGKAALEMFTSVAQVEQEKIRTSFPIKFYSVAPGIVDTLMQEEIRATNPESFSGVDKFIAYKANNKLLSVYDVAVKLNYLIENSNKISSTILDLHELGL